MFLNFLTVLLVLHNEFITTQQLVIPNQKEIVHKGKCKNIKCPPTEDPVCVKIKNETNNHIAFIVAINKCEIQYAKCRQGLDAVIVSMKYCQHALGNSRKGSKRHKRETETEDKQPDYAIFLSKDDEGENDNGTDRLPNYAVFVEKNGSAEYVKEEDPQEAEDENEPTEEFNEGAVEGDNEDPGEVGNEEAVERDNEEALEENNDEADEDDQAIEESNEEAVERDNDEAVEENNEEAVEENNEGADEDDRAMEGNNEEAVEGDNEDAVEENNEEAVDENDEEAVDENNEDAVEENNEDAVEENNEEDVQGDNEVDGEGENEIDVQEVKVDNEQEDEKNQKETDISGKTLLNTYDDEEQQKEEGESLNKEDREDDSEKSKDISDLAADYDQITEDADLDQNEKDCPTVCAARDVMVCAKCQHNIYRTFMSSCHLRLFNCKYPDEKLELISRQPCMQSAPFLTDLPGAQGRISEPGDQDNVLKFIHCRDKGKLDDPRCNFDR